MIKIKIDIFETNLYISENKKDINKILKLTKSKNSYEEFIEKYDGIYNSEFTDKFIILNTKRIHILVHELLHCVQDLCEHRNINDNEFEAYLLDYLVKKSLSKLKNIGV